jgi:hypothetical protein
LWLGFAAAGGGVEDGIGAAMGTIAAREDGSGVFFFLSFVRV